MSDAGEKTFDPTPARLAKAQREGNTARAGELGANAAFLCALTSLPAVIPAIAAAARAGVIQATTGQLPLDPCAVLMAWMVVPIAAGATGASIASLIQNGGLQVAPPALKPERLNPFSGIKRLFSRETSGHLIRASIGFVCALAAMVPAAIALCAAVLRGAPLLALTRIASTAALRECLCASAVGLAFALVEYASARRNWLGRLRMTFAEFKREMREQDGDPQTRSRRRALHRSLTAGDVRRLKEAAFVVCNPTHIAIALAYRPPDEPVPRVLVRAADDVALRVRELAVELGIPIVENVGLARALFAQARAGATIPHDQYVAVAEVVAALIAAGALT
jgi:flagellar biosynthesis protein FlhB